MEKQNRAQRRKSRFGGGRATEHSGWPTSRPNPVFGAEPTANAVTSDQTDEPEAKTADQGDQAASAPPSADDAKG